MFSILAALVALGGLVNAQGYVSLPFTKESLDRNLSASTPLHRRKVLGYLEDEVLIYLVSFSLGNNQKQKGILDTGSSDLWVYSSRTSAEFTYDPSGAEFINDNFEMSYFDGSKAQGSYYKDTLTLGGVTIDAQFGVSEIYNGYHPWGWFGIGRRHLESTYFEREGTYDNYPYALRDAGQIETASYSLNLNWRGAKTGTVLFGAVDTSRYIGKLQLIRGRDDAFFTVPFSVEGCKLVGMLDSGSTFTFLPDYIVSRIAASVGAEWSYHWQSYVAYHRPDNVGLTFNFFGTEVTVPSSELLQPTDQGSTIYKLTVRPTSGNNGKVILGDSFLRSAYTVYDLEHNLVAIAQASWSNRPANYRLITSAGIPGASF